MIDIENVRATAGVHRLQGHDLLADMLDEMATEVERDRLLIEAHRMLLRGLSAAWVRHSTAASAGELADASTTIDDLLATAGHQGMVAG